MGATSSKEIEAAIMATSLPALSTKIAVVSPHLCAVGPKRLLSKTKRQVALASMGASVSLRVTIRDVTNKSDDDEMFVVDGYQVLRDRDGIPLAMLVGNQLSRTFDVRDPKSNRTLLTIERVLVSGEPTAVATFQDRIFGKRYILGYTGDWTRHHLAVFWVASADVLKTDPAEPTDPLAPTRQPIARVYPSRKLGLDVSYCIEVAPGMDMGLVALLCFVLDYSGDNLMGSMRCP
ncbi:hypothetical protein PINS_up008282 [Pythium insidiosum]|nr:hypothetical protein PINS_up008282 [Pythium insidiosum]